jgi:hypothetical protein
MLVPTPRGTGSWLGLGHYFNNNLEGRSWLEAFRYGGGGLEREQEALSQEPSTSLVSVRKTYSKGA